MIQKEQIEKAVAVLKAGGVILYPTDTIWGIGCERHKRGGGRKSLRAQAEIRLQEPDYPGRRHEHGGPLCPGDSRDGRHRRVPERQAPDHHLPGRHQPGFQRRRTAALPSGFQRASIVLSCSALSASPSSPHRPMSQAHQLRRDTLISPMTSRPQWTSPLILPASRTPPARHLPSSSSACTTKYRSSGNSLSRPA